MKKLALKTLLSVTLTATIVSPTASFASTPLVNTTSATEYWDASEVAYMTEIEAEFRALNPDATNEQVENHIKGIIHQSVIDSMNANTNPELLPYLVADLSEIEKALYFENTAVGDAVLYEAMIATNAANATGLPGDLNGKRDAFRHAYWNALMLDAVGRYWATRWATAHEDGAVGQPAIQRTMDMTNNERGRQAAEDVINVNWVVTDAELKNQVMWYLNNGKLVYIKNGYLVASNT